METNINLINSNKKTKCKSIISICFFVFLCLLLSISFFKVPVVGKLLDAIFFEFLFGHVKMIIYAWLIIMLSTWYKKDYFFSLFSKRKILSYILITFLLCFFSAILTFYMNNEKDMKFINFFKDNKYAFFDNWYDQNIKNLLDFKKSFLVLNKYALGGFIGVIYASCLNEFVMITFFIIYTIITFFITIMCYSDKLLFKFNNWIIKLCGGYISKEINFKEQTICFESVLENKKEAIIKKLNIENSKIEIQNNQIIINIEEFNDLKNVIDCLKKININDVKIKFNNNEIELEKE